MVLVVVINDSSLSSTMERVVETKAPVYKAIHEGDSLLLLIVSEAVEAGSNYQTILVELVHPFFVILAVKVFVN